MLMQRMLSLLTATILRSSLAAVGDPSTSNSGEPAPPMSARTLAWITDVEFQVMESWPMQVSAIVSGDLPGPCNTLWWEVAVEDKTYDIQVWHLGPPPDTACPAVIEPFTENIPLGGGFVNGDYTVIVNGKEHPLSL